MSDHRFWALPGPISFLDRIARQLLEGQHVAILMPRDGPSDIREEVLANKLSSRLNIEPLLLCEETPEEDILGVSISGATCASATQISDMLEFSGRIFWLDGVDPYRWPKWRNFLEDLQHVTRNQARLSRVLFVVELTSDLAIQPPMDGGGIAILKWDEIVTRYDMLQYADLLTRPRSLMKLERALTIELLARLAGYDPEVVECLAGSALNDLLESDVDLLQLGQRRGWTDGEASWVRGSLMNVGGEMFLHSSVPTASKERQQRRWSALIATVYVELEEMRRDISDKYAALLGTGSRALEYPELYERLYKLSASGQVSLPKGSLNRLSNLRFIRNKLAHFEIPPSELIESGLLSKKL